MSKREAGSLPAPARRTEEIGLGDLAAAFELLQPQEAAVQARIARLLGLRALPAVTATPEAQPAAEGAASEAASASARLPRPTTLRRDRRPAARPAALGDRAPLRARVTLVDSEAPAKEPAWPDEPEVWPAPPKDVKAGPLAPLVPPLLLRALVSDQLASPLPAGQVDVERLVDIIARAEPVRAIPRRPVPSLRHGVQVLIDTAPGMAPFAEDQGRLLEDVRHLVGVDHLAVYWFEGCPLRGVYAAGQDAAQPYAAPQPGTTVLLLTDLGIARPPVGARPATAAEWRRFARAVHEAGGRPVAFVPYSQERWPAALRRALTIVPWDRPLRLRRYGQPPPARATSRPRALARLSPAAFELGKAIALAARVDRSLLRAARLALLPWVDAGAEADLWFSPLVQQRSYASVLFLPEAAAALRAALRDDGQARLEAVWRFLENQRKATGAPYAIRHEETLHYAALHPAIAEEGQANHLLQSALKLLVDEGAARLDVARWAQRAVPRLPESIRRLPAAQELYYASALQLRTQPADEASLPPDLGKLQWARPRQPGVTEVGLRLVEHGLTLSTAIDRDMQRLSVPATAPILLDLRWPGVGEEVSQRVSLTAGGSQAVEVSAVAAATLGRDDAVRLWDLTNIDQLRQWVVGPRPEDSLAFRPGDAVRVTVTANLRAEPFSPGQPAGSMLARVAAGSTVQLVDGPRMVAGQAWWLVDVPTEGPESQRGWVIAHTPDGSPALRALNEPRPRSPLCLAASPDGRILAAGSNDGAIHLWDVLTGELRDLWWDATPAESPRSKASPAQSVGSDAYSDPVRPVGVNALAFSPDGRWLASAGDRGLVRLRRVETGQLVIELDAHAGPALAMAFTPDGRGLASCGADQQAVVWDVATGQELARFAGHKSSVQAVAISPDGQVVASGDADGAVLLWQRSTAAMVRSLEGVRGPVSGLAFRPDGDQLAAAGVGGPVAWDVASGQVVATRPGEPAARRSQAYAVAYTPDCQHLIAGGEDAAVAILATDTLQRRQSFHGLEGGAQGVVVLQLPATRITVQTGAGQRYAIEPDTRRLRFQEPLDFSQRIDSSRRAAHPQVDAALAVIDGWLEAANIAAAEGAAGVTTLMITGEPASGKATLSASLVEIGGGVMAPPAGLGNLRPGFLSARHFCQRDDPATTDAQRFVASLASQLANRWDAYAERLYAAAARRGDLQPAGEPAEGADELAVRLAVGEGASPPSISAAEALHLYLIAPLRSLAAAGHDRPIVLLVDSLHDADGGERNLLRLLPALVELPGNVRLLFVTRATAEVDAALAPLGPQRYALSSQARPAPYPASGTSSGDSLTADDRQRLVGLVAVQVGELTGGRTALLIRSGLERLLPTVDLTGPDRLVAANLVESAERFGWLDDRPQYTALGALIRGMLDGDPATIVPEDRQFLADIIAQYGLITDPEYLATLSPQPAPQPAPLPSGSLIDRERERLLFDEMLYGKRLERILFLRGEQGMGKTMLLTAWRDQLRADRRAVPAYVSLGNPDLANEQDVMGWLAAQVPGLAQSATPTSTREGTRAPQAGGQEQVGPLPGVGDSLSGTVVEKLRSVVAAYPPSEEADFQFGLASRAENTQVVILIDDLEQARGGVRAWLQERFLPWVAEARMPKLIVVVAGRETPEMRMDHADLTLTLELGPLPMEAVREFLAAAGAPPGIDAEALYKLSEGRPELLAQLLSRAGAKLSSA